MTDSVTHYYDGGGAPLCGADVRTWNWSVDLRAVSCTECLDRIGEQLRLAFPTSLAPVPAPDPSPGFGRR